MKLGLFLPVAGLLAAGCTVAPKHASSAPVSETLADSRVVPLVDHHAHIISARAAHGSYPLPVAEIALPGELAELLTARQRRWNDPAALARLYTSDATVLNTGNEDMPSWLKGRSAAADYVGTLFGRPHRIKPTAYGISGGRAFIAGYFHRPEIDRHFGHVLLSLERGSDRKWRIAAEAPVFPGPPGIAEFNADALVKELDDAGVRRAVVLSVAYWFGSAFRSTAGGDEYAGVRAENDWVAAEAARHPDRLISFCSVNPLKAYALAEIRRCGGEDRHRGLKLHLGNSDVDLRKADHAAKVAAVFAEANRQALPVIVHLWTDPSFETEGDAHARAFLEHVLPSAPDVAVQIAHMAGGGRATHRALKVFADAIAAGDPRTRSLYFDVATLTAGETPQNLHIDAAMIRQIGLDRILFGSDTSQAARPVWQQWPALHALPLTEAEFGRIAGNVAPYMH